MSTTRRDSSVFKKAMPALFRASHTDIKTLVSELLMASLNKQKNSRTQRY